MDDEGGGELVYILVMVLKPLSIVLAPPDLFVAEM